jgi:hypothetical protein
MNLSSPHVIYTSVSLNAICEYSINGDQNFGDLTNEQKQRSTQKDKTMDDIQTKLMRIARNGLQQPNNNTASQSLAVMSVAHYVNTSGQTSEYLRQPTVSPPVLEEPFG